MSNLSGKLTTAGHALIAARIASNATLVLNEFVFANVPGLDPDTPPDSYSQTIPTAHIVHTQPVTKTGYYDNDTVVYSVVLNSTIGDFDFNWVGLCDDNGDLVILKYVNLQEKRGNAFGEGNNLNRNFALKFTGAATVTNITVPAESWQYDMTSALIQLQNNIDTEKQQREQADTNINLSLFYSNTKNYVVDDGVFGSNGRRYICIQANGPASTVRALTDQNYWLIEYKYTFHKNNPVGRILYSHDNTNPSTIYGTWSLIAQGQTIVGVNTSDSDFNTPGKSGGSKTHNHAKGTLKADGHQLTVAELPKFTVKTPFSTGENDGGASGQDVRGNNQYLREFVATSDEIGGDQAHDHTVSGSTANSSSLMPYVAEYIWKRTA